MTKPRSKRKELSDERAQLVCRELRWLLANNARDYSKVAELVSSWMDVTDKKKWIRPS